MSIKKILVVEDEMFFRECLVEWLQKENYCVVGEAGSLAEAEELSSRTDYDLVLLDMDLPDGEGMQFVEREMERRPTVRILVLTAHIANYPVVKLKRSGAMGVMDKAETSGKELRHALKALSEWRTYYSERVERYFRNLVRESTAFYKTLSSREEELLKLFGMGSSNEKVAEDLGLSVATVQGHRRNIMSKVGVNSTPDLIIWAIRNGFVLGPQIGRTKPDRKKKAG